MTVVAGVDIGGTKIAVGVVTGSGEVLARHTVPTPAADGPDAVLTAVTSAVRALEVPVAAVGVGSAGVIDPDAGVVRSATDAMAGWPGTDLRGELHARLGLPVAVDNDVHAHAIGEAWKGAAAGYHHVLFVAVGTGVGASLVLDGRVYHGAHAVAGHAGHIAVPGATGRTCTCGGSGHAEAVASGPALLAEYRQRSGDTSMSGLVGVSRRADEGDPIAVEVLSEGAVALGQAIGGLVNVMDPDLVLLGGGVSSCGEAWWEPLQSTIAAETLPPLRGISIVTSQLGGNAAMIGAGKIGWEALAGREALA